MSFSHLQRRAGNPLVETCPRCGTKHFMVEMVIGDREDPYEIYLGPLEHCDTCRWTAKEDNAAFERVVRRRLQEGALSLS